MFARSPQKKQSVKMTGTTTTGSRIPAALQNIFLQSQRGDDVEKIASPGGIGFRIFRRLDRRNKSRRNVKAPDVNSLYAERNGIKDSAATASRKAMKKRSDHSSMMVSCVAPCLGWVIEAIPSHKFCFPYFATTLLDFG